MIISSNFVKKGLDIAGKCLHAPEQRLILGATALLTQPLIDLKNKDVDEDTRMMSVSRTLAKIVAGTLVGVAVRCIGIGIVSAFSKHIPLYKDLPGTLILGIIPKSKKDFLTPRFLLKPFESCSYAEWVRRYKNYKKGFGTLLATVAMVFTNFACDAPLTKYFTDVFYRKIKGHKDRKKETEVKQ